MCTKHKTPNKSHSWLALLGSLCSARIRVRPLTRRLALHARDTGGRGGGEGRSLRSARFAQLALLGLLRLACFARLASLGSLCSACFARLALLGLLRLACYAWLALLGLLQSACFDRLTSGCDRHRWFPCLGHQCKPHQKIERNVAPWPQVAAVKRQDTTINPESA
jgi:hypothetical protein